MWHQTASHVILSRHLPSILTNTKSCASRKSNNIFSVVSVNPCKPSTWAFMSPRITISWLSPWSLMPKEMHCNSLGFSLTGPQIHYAKERPEPFYNTLLPIYGAYSSPQFFSSHDYMWVPPPPLYVHVPSCCNLSKSIIKSWAAPPCPLNVLSQLRRG